ncbi:hypothetical protein HP550_14475 [Cellulomonas humilata]|uniref:DUF91 domain-containing protein n=1 Tax=Cellulomonas humilata TaxID=144055 RepID=A0A7Y6DYX4_9CELL|nr:hypothetical protein [Cellulomonas humilata]NUU18459.1 hypothetical protein [Cellulomonas humilata]
MLYDLTTGALQKVPPTTFAAEHILERTHLQAAVRDHIEVLGGDLLVIAEEFGDFEDAHRRIDLLCLDRSGRLVVVELKRTDGGGHMELQALRYAAMVSVMTFDDLVSTYARHKQRLGLESSDESSVRAAVLDWLGTGDEEPVIGREVAIVLASADFSQEVATTVLWLNEFYGMDIRCVRLSPYKHDGHLLLDVQQVIPLPEAEELVVRLKRREAAVRESRNDSHDLTRYAITTPGGETDPLPKRKAVQALVRALHELGVPPEQIATQLPAGRFLVVAGTPEGDELWSAFAQTYGRTPENRRRWFLDDPIIDSGQTWVLFSNWGTNTLETLRGLVSLAPGVVGFSAKA